MKWKLRLPFDDERTRKVKIYSAGKAYFYSLYIWIVLFVFHKFLDIDDLLLIGLFGMAGSLYVSWLLTRKQKGLE